MSTVFLSRLRSTLVNPICLKSARGRLRLRHTLSWGTITVTVTNDDGEEDDWTEWVYTCGEAE